MQGRRNRQERHANKMCFLTRQASGNLRLQLRPVTKKGAKDGQSSSLFGDRLYTR